MMGSSEEIYIPNKEVGKRQTKAIAPRINKAGNTIACFVIEYCRSNPWPRHIKKDLKICEDELYQT